ncbi:MAG: hypothetical protein HYY49_06530 [Ignavibacteriales bacterium]|nr:hypothetical protein [Ignavibacteriales bacterium]
MAKAIKAKLVSPTQVEISVSEGKNKQVRKMFEAIGYVVLELKRTSHGPLALGSMKEGKKRDLSKEEISSLRDLMRNRRSASRRSERRRRQQHKDRHHA